MADEYTGLVVTGPPEVHHQLRCVALVKVRKGVYRRCHKYAEFAVTMTNYRGFSDEICWTHTQANTITVALEPF